MSRSSTAVLLCLLLAALTLATFSPIRNNGFVFFDDGDYVVNNPVVRDGLSRRGLGWAFTTFHTGNWHPTTWVSHLIDGELFGVGMPAGHLVHNLLLHTASAVALLLLLRRMTGALAPSFFVAAVFAVHPLQVESITWVAERKTVLAMFFWMLSLLAYVHYTDRPGFVRYVPVVIAFALALMAKQTVVTLPFVLLLLDYWPLGRVGRAASWRGGEKAARRVGEAGASFDSPLIKTSRERKRAPGRTGGVSNRSGRLLFRLGGSTAERAERHGDLPPSQAPGWDHLPSRLLVVEKLPLFAMTAASCLMTVLVQAQAGLVKAGTTRPLGARLENAVVSYVAYLRKMLWPTDLAVFYPHPGDSLPAWKVGGSLVLLLAITGWVFYRRQKRPYLIVGWLWYVGTLVPLIGLIQAGLHAMTDRHSYIPLVGIYIALAWLLADVARDWKLPRSFLSATGTALVLVLAVLSWRQTRLWENSIKLFEHTIAVTENNDVARYNLALVLERAGRRPEAIRYYREAVAINPDYISAGLNLGAALAQEGRLDEAANQFKTLLERKPDDAMGHHNLANVLVELGREDEAKTHYREAMRVRPDWSQPVIGLTWILASSRSHAQRDAGEAVRLGQKAEQLIRQGPPPELALLPNALDALAAAEAEAGRFSDATRTALEAVELAEQMGNARLVSEIRRHRLPRYREDRPYRHPP